MDYEKSRRGGKTKRDDGGGTKRDSEKGRRSATKTKNDEEGRWEER